MNPATPNTNNHEELLAQANEAIYKQNFELAITNKTLSILHSLYSITMSSLEVTEVAQRLVDTIVKELNLSAAIISLIDTDPNTNLPYTSPIAITRSENIEQALKKIGKPLKEIQIPLSFTGNLINAAIESRTRQITGNLLDILNPVVTQQVSDEIEKFIDIKTIVIYPLFVGKKPLGALTVGLSKQVDDLSRAEKETLERLIDLVSLAIDRAQLHQNVEEANEKLKVLDKIKDDFVSLASHELRTPMTAIKSYTWLVANDKEGLIPDKAKEHLQKVLVSTDRLIHLVNELLDISRIESGRVTLKMESFEVGKLLTDVCEEFQAKAQETKVQLICPTTTYLPSIKADREKIHQVLENLIGNAMKFTPENGQITYGVKVNSQNIEFFVTDTGPGIHPEDMPKLFQKFGRLENSLIASRGPSTGLGLFICKQYIELHEGKIWASSEPGHGATFTFTLPL